MSVTRARRVLLVHRHFDPDMTTYAQMLGCFAEHLGRIGHDVTVLCGPANYNGILADAPSPRYEEREHFTVRRVRLPTSSGRIGKSIGFALFPLAMILHCWSARRSYDTVSVTTIPPVVMGLAGVIATKRGNGAVIYHCMDLYPEVLGPRQSAIGRLVAWAARRLDTHTMRRARRVIVLSDDMKSTIADRGYEIEPAVCNNFIIESYDGPLPSVEAGRTFRLIFAGNLGRFQGIERLLDSFLGSDEDIELLFLGTGPMVETIKNAALRDPRIMHHPYVPLKKAMLEILRADAAVVSLAPGVIRSAYPSKVLMYLELGRRILALVEPDSSLAHTLEHERLGVAAAPGDVDGLAQSLRTIRDGAPFRSPSEIQAYGRANFCKPVILDRWTELYGLELAT